MNKYDVYYAARSLPTFAQEERFLAWQEDYLEWFHRYGEAMNTSKQLRFVDWDWTGERGPNYYPLLRNEATLSEKELALLAEIQPLIWQGMAEERDLDDLHFSVRSAWYESKDQLRDYCTQCASYNEWWMLHRHLEDTDWQERYDKIVSDSDPFSWLDPLADLCYDYKAYRYALGEDLFAEDTNSNF